MWRRGFPPRPCRRKCARRIRRCNIWWARPAGEAKPTFTLCKDKVRLARKREGRHLLRTNLTGGRSADERWQFYIQLTEVVHLLTTDERTVILRRYTHPETDVQLLLQQLKLELPAQPPPKVTRPTPSGGTSSVVKT